MKKSCLALAVLLCTSTTFAANKACEENKDAAIPLDDQNTAPLKASDLKACNSAWEYYGLSDGGTDYAKARVCAFHERRKSDKTASGVLMMLYANGEGVAKSEALALRFACELDPRDQEALIVNITKATDNVDYCGSPASDKAVEVCADLKLKRAELDEANALEKLASPLEGEIRNKYDLLMESVDIYFASEAERLVPKGTSERARKITIKRHEMYHALLSTLQRLEKTSSLQVTRISLKQAVEVLTKDLAAYRKANPEMNPEPLLHAQKDWEKYRDSFANYGSARYSPKNVEMWKAELTRERDLEFKASGK